MSEDVFARINSHDHGVVEFKTEQELRDFMNAQLPAWEWVRQLDANMYQHLANVLNNTIAHMGAGQRQTYLDQAFQHYRFPIVGSPIAEFIERVRSEKGSAVALAILGTITRSQNFDLSRPDHLKALSALVVYEEGLSTRSVEASQASLRRTATSMQRQEAASRSKGTQYENKIAEAEARSQRVVSLAKRYVAHKLQRQRETDDLRVRASLDDMETTKALYMEHMALRAPVEYWKKKAGEHRSGARTMRKFLLGYAVVGTVILLSGLYYLFTRSIEVVTAGAPVSVLFILATMGVVVTTIAFWGGRILTRLYLSEEHLKIDAGERATMVETYLALTSVSQASTEDRAIILASLFRPTADGIVKDDAAPEFSPGGIISRIVTPG